MPKKKSAKKTKQKFQPFKPTFNKVFTLAITVQFGLIGMLGFTLHEWWKLDQNESRANFIKMISESNDKLYDLAQNESVYIYNDKAIEWPRYGLAIPQDVKFGEIYLFSYVEEDYKTSDIQITNDSARGYSSSYYGDSLESIFNNTVPVMQVCNRMIVAMPNDEQPPYDDYQQEFSKTFKDGRSYTFYSNERCNPDDKPEFVEYLKQIDSL